MHPCSLGLDTSQHALTPSVTEFNRSHSYTDCEVSEQTWQWLSSAFQHCQFARKQLPDKLLRGDRKILWSCLPPTCFVVIRDDMLAL